MSIKIRFFGAAQNVTGSSYVVEIDGSRLLVDCGLYQEREFKSRNWDPFPVPPQDIDAVLLTHAHLDHCGRLPKLVRGGFSGPIHCTPATADIAKIVLLDSARIQEELGWRPAHDLDSGLGATVRWYLEHRDWCEAVQAGGYHRERLGLSGDPVP